MPLLGPRNPICLQWFALCLFFPSEPTKTFFLFPGEKGRGRDWLMIECCAGAPQATGRAATDPTSSRNQTRQHYSSWIVKVCIKKCTNKAAFRLAFLKSSFLYALHSRSLKERWRVRFLEEAELATARPVHSGRGGYEPAGH